MRGRGTLAGVAAAGALVIAGCGDAGTTTVIQSTPTEAQTATVTEQTTTVTENSAPKVQAKVPPPAPETTAASSSPPDVVGLTLPAAQKALKSAGFKADVSNTDTTFGILVPENYTVCKESDPVGSLVPILAQKYGC
jgi:beta-lactam-binding protein with PASTA domain